MNKKVKGFYARTSFVITNDTLKTCIDKSTHTRTRVSRSVSVASQVDRC